MEKRKALDVLFVLCLLSSLGIIAYQQAHIQRLEVGDVIPINESADWGATVYMRIYRDGFLLSEESHHNVITNAGRSALRGHIGDSAIAEWNYLAIGTSTGGDASSTTLENEYSRYQGAYATVGSYNFTITFTWTAGNFSGQTIVEYGLLNAAASGTLLSYNDDFSRGPLTASDTLQVIANIQMGS